MFAFSAVCFYKGWFYFSAANRNGLFRWNREKNEVVFLGFFGQELLFQSDIHSHAIIYKDEIYFIPLYGFGISVYNLVNEQMSYITNARTGCGLIRYGGSIVPFVNRMPKGKLYNLNTTKPSDRKEMIHSKQQMG